MAKMLNLVPAIKAIQSQIREIEYEYQVKLKPFNDSLKQLREINEACERCNGEGKILRNRSCAEDDAPDPNDPRDYRVCPDCKGSGYSHKGLEIIVDKEVDCKWSIN